MRHFRSRTSPSRGHRDEIGTVTIQGLLQLLTWRQALDIALVALVFYYILLLIRGTRAVQVLLGMSFLVVVYFVARATGLHALYEILDKFLIVLPFAVIVLFQSEIRRALARFGRNPLWGFRGQGKVVSGFEDIVLASTALAAKRQGALIVVERLEGLREFAQNGIAIDGQLSYDLLVNIFNPGAPLHDGAVLIHQDRVVAAGCFLPLSLGAEISTSLGTRHRAAIGITRETDALAVVVSEETGTISVGIAGTLQRDLDATTLRNLLYKYLVTDLYPQNKKGAA